MISMNTKWYLRFNNAIISKSAATLKKSKNQISAGAALDQVSLLTLMVGNLLEKSWAVAAILTATWRATAL